MYQLSYCLLKLYSCSAGGINQGWVGGSWGRTYDIVQSITTSMGLKERDNGRDSALYALSKADDV